jgi:hypothetical protein
MNRIRLAKSTLAPDESSSVGWCIGEKRSDKDRVGVGDRNVYIHITLFVFQWIRFDDIDTWGSNTVQMSFIHPETTHIEIPRRLIERDDQLMVFILQSVSKHQAGIETKEMDGC